MALRSAWAAGWGSDLGRVLASLGRPTSSMGLAGSRSAVNKQQHKVFQVDQQRRREAASCDSA